MGEFVILKKDGRGFVLGGRVEKRQAQKESRMWMKRSERGFY